MNTFTGLPDCKTIVFILNPESGYYDRISSPLGFEKIPPELKVEETIKKDQINSSLIIRGRVKNGKYLFFTGLLPVTSNIFFGDHFEYIRGQKVNSFILFIFSPGNEKVTLYFFNHFKLYPDKRGKFISDILKTL